MISEISIILSNVLSLRQSLVRINFVQWFFDVPLNILTSQSTKNILAKQRFFICDISQSYEPPRAFTILENSSVTNGSSLTEKPHIISRFCGRQRVAPSNGTFGQRWRWDFMVPRYPNRYVKFASPLNLSISPLLSSSSLFIDSNYSDLNSVYTWIQLFQLCYIES